jgi:hypothetical protein
MVPFLLRSLIIRVIKPKAKHFGFINCKIAKTEPQFKIQVAWALYTTMRLSDKLDVHLIDTDAQAGRMLSERVKQMVQCQGITEALKYSHLDYKSKITSAKVMDHVLALPGTQSQG